MQNKYIAHSITDNNCFSGPLLTLMQFEGFNIFDLFRWLHYNHTFVDLPGVYYNINIKWNKILQYQTKNRE